MTYFSKSYRMVKLLAILLVSLINISCEEDRKKVVVCWGDSLTAPNDDEGVKGVIKEALGKRTKAYPSILASLLGDEYEVINAGVGGENTLTIMARQGAYPMMLAHDVTVFKKSQSDNDVIIGTADIPAFVSSYNGEKVTPLLQLGWDENSPAHINPCIIGGGNFV